MHNWSGASPFQLSVKPRDEPRLQSSARDFSASRHSTRRQRIEASERFAREVAHELKNPLHGALIKVVTKACLPSRGSQTGNIAHCLGSNFAQATPEPDYVGLDQENAFGRPRRGEHDKSETEQALTEATKGQPLAASARRRRSSGARTS